MKKVLTLLIVASALLSCKQEAKKETIEDNTVVTEEPTIDMSMYPDGLQRVFITHGGLDLWNKMQSLTFEIKQEEGVEKHFINLWNRKDRIDTDAFSIGYDGNDVWLKQDGDAYKGNARFYHNLMFYFQAMPFVLADDGITYEKVENLTYGDKWYPGYKISFAKGVGDSSNDNYFIHYDPETYQMAWLGYTVTYGQEEESDNVRYIRYAGWENLDGIILPNQINWHKVEDGKIGEERNSVNFGNIEISEIPYGENVFEKPEGAVVVEK